ncbi:uncharacterized protein [Nicotiana tomentosiformis]|uniref:DUF6821 domain-containing protein n=1 Tax=Nicotiana tabacum TaxID=4097 RepID=A0A1S4C1V0_TOBAC|nr:uncharacterized protein LOC104095139 [Nicotiana tomentosiformis]XP_016495063.1 PREDICTED: uncharacterized protein LOC107814212 [Nicotiana tabacum]
MDLETEWELLPNNGLLEIHDYGFKKYDSQFVDSTEHSRVPNQLIIPLPNQLNPNSQKIQEDDEVIKEVITKVPVEGATMVENEQDQVSQVFFKKMKETEYENMKLDSPKFSNKTFVSQIDSDPLQFEDKAEVIDKENVIKKRENMEADIEKNNGGLNIWNWSLTGIGAICSFGIAAVTICIFIGNHQKQKQNKQNQKLNFQFSDDKKMKQVVQQTTELNETICGVSGVPITKKRITDVEGLLLRSLEHIQDCLSVS